MSKKNPFQRLEPGEAARRLEPLVHVYGDGVVCKTDVRGHATPRNRSLKEIVLHAPGGFIRLWNIDSTLRWRFQKRSLQSFVDPEAAEEAITDLFADALLAWDDAAPVRFSQGDEVWDFEIVMMDVDDCDPNGCVLASAFFPNGGGRNKLVLYPEMFNQTRKEQVETLVHEVGHAFGLRHFFANISEKAWPSEVFGTHKSFSIMNYGAKSVLTKADKTDLKNLYELAWSGQLTHINGTKIKLVTPSSGS